METLCVRHTWFYLWDVACNWSQQGLRLKILCSHCQIDRHLTHFRLHRKLYRSSGLPMRPNEALHTHLYCNPSVCSSHCWGVSGVMATCLLQLICHLEVQVTVVGQVLPVQMSIRMQLTSTHISFRPRSIDFGQCNLGENTGVVVQVTNHSSLPQKYGELSAPRLCFNPDFFCA